MNTIHFETLGCKLNQIETESLAHAFEEAGFGIDRAADGEPLEGMSPVSSVYRPTGIKSTIPTGLGIIRTAPILSIVNTCTVTSKSEQKARRLIRLLLGKYPESPVLVTGCYAEVERDAIAAIDRRIVVFPGSRKGELAELPAWISNRALRHPEESLLAALRAFCGGGDSGSGSGDGSPESGAAVDSGRSSTFNLSTDTFLFHSRASIKIQDGCNNRCAYCRIRIARGKAVSLDAGEVVDRIRKIEEAGMHEVVLTGVNLTQYRSDDGDFAGLLGRILAETDRIAIRISSLYPERIDDAILPFLASPRIRPHFHLSVQSGSDRILRAMRRPYTAETVFAAADRLRSVKENPFLACDIITGFPGETEEDFGLTLEMCRKIGFAWIHAFPFSARPGTEAWGMKPKIPERVAGERVHILTALAEENHRNYRGSWIGRELEAIAEKVPEGKPVSAVTENYLTVTLPPGTASGGDRLLVRVDGDGTASFVKAFPA